MHVKITTPRPTRKLNGRPGTMTAMPIRKLAPSVARRIPEYTIGAASLRKPAFANFVFRAFCSVSVCGIRGLEIDFTASASPWNLFLVVVFVGSSISDNEAGRLKRESRSRAWLLRLEIMDKNAQIAATIP